MKDKKIALVAINSRNSHTNLALYYAMRILEKKGEAPDLIELTINENWKESLEKLTSDDYGIYLFSVYIWNSDRVRELLPLLRGICPGAVIIAGGPEITYKLDYWRDLKLTDHLVGGQIEWLADNLRELSGPVIHSLPTPINEVPFPYIPDDKERLTGKLVYYEASRGCLFNCAYCLSSCSDQRLEYRDKQRVIEELEKLIDLKPKVVKMVDRTFNSKKEYARAIWRYLIERNSPVPFHFELHPLFLEEEDFKILAKAPVGLFQFEIGIQSTNKEVLGEVGRPFNWEKERGNIKRVCALKNIHSHLDQIVGLPLDTEEIARSSFNDIMELRPEEFQMGFLKLLPGTILSKKKDEYDLTVNACPPYEVVSTSTMDFKIFQKFYGLENELGRFYNSGAFNHTMNHLLDLSPTPFQLLESLISYAPEERRVKVWGRLGESLINLCGDLWPDELIYVKDLLRFDWCPFASSQSFPPFLRIESDDRIKDLRRGVFDNLMKQEVGFTRRDFNHAILFVPESKRLKEELEGVAILFYKREKKSHQISLEKL